MTTGDIPLACRSLRQAAGLGAPPFAPGFNFRTACYATTIQRMIAR